MKCRQYLFIYIIFKIDRFRWRFCGVKYKLSHFFELTESLNENQIIEIGLTKQSFISGIF